MWSATDGVADPCHAELHREASLVLGATGVGHRPTGAAAEAGVLDPAPRLEVEEQPMGQVGVEPVANGDAQGRREAHHSGRVEHQILWSGDVRRHLRTSRGTRRDPSAGRTVAGQLGPSPGPTRGRSSPRTVLACVR